ncbi:MAG: hypothetical protein QOE77_4252 [Blastocatellia bacterium]|jgi:hypothetical protein|nr:hypothetical protein [Blastocatellia bacterium]
MAYFHRLSDSTFLATEHVSGAWNTAEQHIAPALGLLAHAVELDRDARRGDGLVLARLSYDILGTVPVAAFEIAVRVLRPGRTIELVEASLSHDDRVAVALRAWLLQPRDTARLRGSALVPIPGPDALPDWDPTAVWPGGFIASAEVRRSQAEPGRAAYWVRPGQPLLDGEPVSPMARAAGLLDISNGMTVRVHPKEVAFPNVDLTAHLFAEPRGEWLGFDTTVSFGTDGIGVTSSVLYDLDGPVGTMSQILTVRPS